MAVEPLDPNLAADILGALVARRRVPPADLSPAAIRRRAGIGTRDLGLLLGVHATTVSRWESGELIPSPEHAAAWSAALQAMASVARS